MSQMATELSISSSEVHAALKRLVPSQLVSGDTDGNRPLLEAVVEFLVHEVKYAFPAKRGEMTRGLPPSYAAPPLKHHGEGGSDPHLCGHSRTLSTRAPDERARGFEDRSIPAFDARGRGEAKLRPPPAGRCGAAPHSLPVSSFKMRSAVAETAS